MAIEQLFKRESRKRTIRLSNSTGPIAHVDILGLKVLLIIKGITVLKFMKDEGSGMEAGFTELTTETEAGEYSWEFTEAQSGLFPEGTMTLEVYRRYALEGTFSSRKISQQKLYQVKKSQLFTDNI